MHNDKVILQVNDLKKYFSLRKGFFSETKYIRAVDGVSFELYQGETLGIIGESGCGKSTLGRSLVNLYNITSGSVVYNDENQKIDLINASEREKKNYTKSVQIIFQDPFSSLNPRINVFETVAEPLIIHQYPKEVIEQKVSEVIAQVGLRDEHLRRYPHSFSGGQRQRIGIARSLIISPRVIICDEAVSALDVSVQAQIINLLKELQKRYHYSYVFISHDMSVIRHICDRIAVMYAGRIVEFGTKDEVLNSPQYPYTEALLDAVPKISNRKSKGKRKILLGEPPDLSKERTGCSMFERCGYRIDACQITPMKLSDARNQHLTACMRTKEIQLNGLNIAAKQP